MYALRNISNGEKYPVEDMQLFFTSSHRNVHEFCATTAFRAEIKNDIKQQHHIKHCTFSIWCFNVKYS